MEQISKEIYKIGIIPVIAIDDAEKAVPLARALVKGGLPAAGVGETKTVLLRRKLVRQRYWRM